MGARPSGIYQFTSVNIPSGVTVSFTPNAQNTPVVWLVQSNCVINGSIKLDALDAIGITGGKGGPGGFRGGNGGGGGVLAGDGLGPGGGIGGTKDNAMEAMRPFHPTEPA